MALCFAPPSTFQTKQHKLSLSTFPILQVKRTHILWLTHLNILNVMKLELRQKSHEYCKETWKAEPSITELHGQDTTLIHTPKTK